MQVGYVKIAIFTALCYASVVYAVVVGLSICVSGIVSKQLNTGSYIQHHTVAQGLLAKFERVTLLGHQMQVE